MFRFMENDVSQQIVKLEQRANSVNIALAQICRTAGIRQNNLSRWKHGLLPSIRVFSRDFPKLEEALVVLEREMAIKLISRINPASAPRIIALLQTPNAARSDGALAPDQERDSRRDGEEAGTTGRPITASGSDRAA